MLESIDDHSDDEDVSRTNFIGRVRITGLCVNRDQYGRYLVHHGNVVTPVKSKKTIQFKVPVRIYGKYKTAPMGGEELVATIVTMLPEFDLALHHKVHRLKTMLDQEGP